MTEIIQTKNKTKELTDTDLNKKWLSLEQYIPIRKSNDPRFGEITIYKDKEQIELIFSKTKIVSSKHQAFMDLRDLLARSVLKHKNIQPFLGHSSSTDRQLCSTNYITTGFYSFPKSDMNKEIQDRIKSGNRFEAAELHYILENLREGIRFLHTNNICHGDIRPMLIEHNREKGTVRLLDRLNDSSSLEKVQQNNLTFKKEVFMSPELYKKLQGRDKTKKYDPFKNDTWALGLVILYAGVRHSIQDIYEANGNFNREKLTSHLEEFDGHYQGQALVLSETIHGLLDLNEESRFDSDLGQQFTSTAQSQTNVNKVNNPEETSQQLPVGPSKFHNAKAESPITEANIQFPTVQQSTSEMTHVVHTETRGDIIEHPIIPGVKGTLVTVIRQDGTPYSFIQTAEGRNYLYEAEPQTVMLKNAVSVQSVPEGDISQSYQQKYQGNVGYAKYQRNVSQSPVSEVEIRKGSSTPKKRMKKSIINKYILEGDTLTKIEQKEEEIVQNQSMFDEKKLSVNDTQDETQPTDESINQTQQVNVLKDQFEPLHTQKEQAPSLNEVEDLTRSSDELKVLDQAIKELKNQAQPIYDSKEQAQPSSESVTKPQLPNEQIDNAYPLNESKDNACPLDESKNDNAHLLDELNNNAHPLDEPKVNVHLLEESNGNVQQLNEFKDQTQQMDESIAQVQQSYELKNETQSVKETESQGQIKEESQYSKQIIELKQENQSLPFI